MIRIAICDDEKNIRAYLRILVRKQDLESEITEYASADEYLSGGMEHDKKTLVIQCGSESRAIPLDSIYYLESWNHKVVLYLKEGELEYYAKIGDPFDKNNNLPVSTKADFLGKPVSMHGIGLSNVKRETAKYLGNVDIKTRKNEFIVTVLLQERSRNGQYNQCKLHDKDVQ